MWTDRRVQTAAIISHAYDTNAAHFLLREDAPSFLCRYDIIKQVGDGTYGSVWRARCRDNGQMVSPRHDTPHYHICDADNKAIHASSHN